MRSIQGILVHFLMLHNSDQWVTYDCQIIDECATKIGTRPIGHDKY